jgi:hypothetical protein
VAMPWRLAVLIGGVVDGDHADSLRRRRLLLALYGGVSAQRGLHFGPPLGGDVGSHDVDDATDLDPEAGHIRLSRPRIDQRLELLGGPDHLFRRDEADFLPARSTGSARYTQHLMGYTSRSRTGDQHHAGTSPVQSTHGP